MPLELVKENLPTVVSREEWRAARVRLLEKEKAATRARDELNVERRGLPMVRVDKDYRFQGPEGEVSLLDLFGDRLQLVIQHFMFDPAWEKGCPGCTASVDETAEGTVRNLGRRATSFVLVARAPLAKLEAYKAEKGWNIPWYSSHGSDFNYDFGATVDPAVAPVEVNYRTRAELEALGRSDFGLTDESHEVPGFSCFLRVDDEVFHTYSTYARGTEPVVGSYGFLDITALGRQEEWEEPKGRLRKARESVPFFEDE